MKYGLYARVSTYDKQNISTQTKYLKEYAEKNNLTPFKIYADVGQSGAKDSRPEFNDLLEDVRSGEVKCIVVYKLDRIGRSLPHLVRLFEEFKNKGVEFISATQSTINTTTPEGRLFLHMLMIFAEYERALIVDRINAGLKRARSEGTKLGRPKGAKDKKRRRKSGYLRRYAGKQS